MPYMLRFVQRFREPDREEFFKLEAQFIALERDIPEFPKGRRYVPFTGREPLNTLIWECEFESLQDVNTALMVLRHDEKHEKLYASQSNFFLDSWTEIFEVFGG